MGTLTMGLSHGAPNQRRRRGTGTRREVAAGEVVRRGLLGPAVGQTYGPLGHLSRVSGLKQG